MLRIRRKESTVKNLARLSLAAFVLVMSTTAALAAETLDSVEKEITDKWAKMTSLTADMATDATMGGAVMKMTGTIEFLNKSGKELFRLEAEFETTDDGRKTKGTTTTIVDGEHQYTLAEFATPTGKVKSATKTNVEDFQGAPIGKKMFEQMKTHNELRLLPGEKVGDTDCYVFEATPRKEGEEIALSKMYFAKDNGVMVKMVSYDADQKAVMTVTYSDIKINVDIVAERFVFTAPEGVEVRDLTQTGLPPAEPQPAAP
jgi:outer membrane lipoprotein-sorting protein